MKRAAAPAVPSPAQLPRKRRMPVRRVLIITGSAVLTLTLVVGGGIWWLYSSADVTTVGSVDFENRLKVPPLADSRIDDQGRRVFDLKMQTDSTSFTAGKQTKTWGFNDSYLGPTLRAKRGEKVVVNVDNALPEQSTVHWHGMHLPAKMDGGPHQMIAPGTMWSPEWTVDQPAASLWYHPHPHGETEKHVQRGLAGMFILDDDNSQQAALPKGYGRDDIPLIVQDAKFNDSGSFDHSRAPSPAPAFSATRSSSTAPPPPTRASTTNSYACACLTAPRPAPSTSALTTAGRSPSSPPTEDSSTPPPPWSVYSSRLANAPKLSSR